MAYPNGSLLDGNVKKESLPSEVCSMAYPNGSLLDGNVKKEKT